jgi:hypothetical protein
MKTLHSPAARRLLALAHPSGPVQHFADGGPVGFGARGLSGLRDLIPKMQAMGYQQAAPAPAPAPAPAEASGAARLYAMIPKIEAMGYKQHRMADGGSVRGPGTGTSDSINAKLSDGEFVMPADTVRKIGVRRLQDLVDMTHTPVNDGGKPNHYANGGFTKFDNDAFVQSMEQQRAASTQASLAAGQAAMAQGEAIAKAAADAKRAQAGAPPAAAPSAEAPAASPASASLEQRVAQIPTGGQTAPAADGSQNSWSNTEVGRNLSNLASALPGSLGGAIPAVAKTGGAISGGIDAATRLLNAGAGAAAISAIPGAAGAQSMPTSTAGAGRGLVNPAAVNPSAPPPVSPTPRVSDASAGGASPATTSDVTRVGNSYSGTNVGGDITVNGRTPGGGFMNSGDTSAPRSAVGMTPEAAAKAGLITSATPVGYNPAYDTRLTGQGGQVSGQNTAAADNLAGRQQQDARGRLMALASGAAPTPTMQAPVVRHSGNDWQSRNDLRNLEVSAKSIMNRPEWSGAGMGRFRGASGPSVDVTAYQSAFEHDRALKALQPAVEQATMRENAGLQREGMQQAGETDRTNIRAQGVNDANQIARGRLTLEQIAAGYSNRSADRIERAQSELEAAKTPEAQRSARDRLLALAGKAPQNEWGVQVTPATKNVDGSTTQGSVWRYNKQTGETVRVDDGQGNAGAVPSKDSMARGQVYQTRGGPMRWNGTSFERIG